jgi:hypothetical protein
MQVFEYAQVSRDDQARNGVSLAARYTYNWPALVQLRQPYVGGGTAVKEIRGPSGSRVIT